MSDEQQGLSAEELNAIRRLVRPLIDALCGQPGSHEVVRVMSAQGELSLTASHLRRIRYALYRPSPDLADLNRAVRYGPLDAGLRARRAALRASEYPEPTA